MKNKPYYTVETGIEKVIRMKKQQEKMKDMMEEVDELRVKQQFESMPKMKFSRK